MFLALEPRGCANDNTTTATTIRTGGRASTRRRWRRAREVVATEPTVVELTWANRRPGTAGFARWTAAVGRHIDEHGLAATTSEVEKLVALARRAGVAPVAADVLADSTQPEPARHRAFAHVVSALVTPQVTIA